MNLIGRLLLTLAAGSLAAGCGDTKDWDREVILRIFKSNGVDVGKVTIIACAGAYGPVRECPKNSSTKAKVVENIFSDCESNRVRIIPPDGAALVSLKVAAAKGGFIPAYRTLKPGSSTEVSVMLGQPGDTIEPKCEKVILDGGPGGDGQKILATGEACTLDQTCAGGRCLKSVEQWGTTIPLPGGYCSRPCDTVGCAKDETCYSNTNGLGATLSKVCLKDCKLLTQCRHTAGYTCTTGEICFPK